MSATVQAYWAQHEPQMDDLTIPFLGPERAERQYPFRDLVEAGAHLAMGSDWAVTTPDPLAQLHVAVNRRRPGWDDVPVFLPDQRLDLLTALFAFTAGSAWVNHDADGGRLAVGARADLVVLDRNMMSGPDEEIADARVRVTGASGRIVYQQ